MQLAARNAQWALTLDMSRCTSLAEVADSLAEGPLPRLGVDRCFLAVYTDDPLSRPAHSGDDSPEPGPANDDGLRARLILNYRHGASGPVSSEVYPIGRLLPTALQGELESGVLVFQPLRASDRELGYILFEQSHGPSQVTEWLRTDLNRALGVLFSMQAQAQAEERLQQAISELHRRAMSDGLTQLANRAHLEEHLAIQWGALARADGELALLMVDVDLFKAYNDHYGHLKGDEALRIVAHYLAGAARYPQDLACRYGGEEFVLALPGANLGSARLVAQRFMESLARAAIPHAASTVAPVVTVSIGIAVGRPQDAVGPWTLLEHADQAMYRAKAQGRNQICTAAPEPGSSEPRLPQPRGSEPAADPALWPLPLDPASPPARWPLSRSSPQPVGVVLPAPRPHRCRRRRWYGSLVLRGRAALNTGANSWSQVPLASVPWMCTGMPGPPVNPGRQSPTTTRPEPHPRPDVVSDLSP
ncbi:MAG: GGDEF domain-containing protein [Actinomycetales bacterium]|nr:GGDEF domain-containing protein [Actinomycetales bacterium]